MKKGLLLILSLFLISGCQVEYNIDIANNRVFEEVLITGSNSEEVNNLKNYQVHNTAFVDEQISSETNELIEGVAYYQQEYSNNRLRLSYNFNDDDYLRSNVVNSCFQYFNYVNDNDNHTISTTKDFNCFNAYPSISTVTVNIKVDFKVSEHNADRVSGNTYTWNLTRNGDNSIYLHGKKDSSDNSSTGDSSNNNSSVSKPSDNEEDKTSIIWVVCGLGAFLVVLLVLIKIKRLKSS